MLFPFGCNNALGISAYKCQIVLRQCDSEDASLEIHE